MAGLMSRAGTPRPLLLTAQRGPALRHACWPAGLAAFGSRAPLAGRSMFELRAALDTVEAGVAPPVPTVELIALPTSDESEQLLRIRHSVRAFVERIIVIYCIISWFKLVYY